MSSLGAHLRELRERRGVSLDEISRTTRVARSYLEALEAGDHAKLPAPVFTRGFIRAYCQVLGEPPDEALGHFNEHAREAGDEGDQPYDRHPRTRTRTRGPVMVSFVLLVVLGVALLAVTLTLRSGREASRRPDVAAVEPRAVGPGAPAPTAPVMAPVVASPESPPGESPPPAHPGAPTASPAPATVPSDVRPERPTPGSEGPGSVATTPVPRPQDGRPPVTATPPSPLTTPAPINTRDVERIVASATAPYRLIARAVEPTWLRVRTEDGRQLSEETIPAGQVREWVSNRRFTVVIGNAGGVKLEFNGVVLPALGPSRAVVELSLPPQAQ